MLNLSGLRLPHSVVISLHNLTHNSVDGFHLQIEDQRRRDAVKTANKWKEQLSPEDKATIDNICRKVLQITGYDGE